jgi:hypothetical protein
VIWLAAKGFAKGDFHDESLLLFFHLAKERNLNIISIMILAFTVRYGMLPTIIRVSNDQLFLSFQTIRVALG